MQPQHGIVNMKKYILWLSTAVIVLLFALTGCEVGSSDEVLRDVSISVEGFYSNDDGKMVSTNTGAPVTSMNVIQDGDQLQGIDNNGMVFSGNLGSGVTASGSTSSALSFTLEGNTTVGADVIISGTFSVSGGSSTMKGTWIEDAFLATVYATASVPDLSVATNDTNDATSDTNETTSVTSDTNETTSVTSDT